MARAKRYIVFTVLAVIFLCGMVYAATSNHANKSFVTGVVDIELNQYHMESGEEAAWSGSATVMPGTKVSLIPRIENLGSDCYVRAKIAFRETHNEITEEHITGFSKDWKKADDGYYYYQGVLGTKESVDLFRGLDIPTDIPQSMANKTFYMDIQVHAIQSKNFKPDYKLADPWGGIKIIEQKNEGGYEFTAFEESGESTFVIQDKGDSGKLIPGLGELFANVSYLMPGDNYSETLKFKNKSNKEIKLYFQNKFQYQTDLADKIKLTITKTQDGKQTIIYNGTLSEADQRTLLTKFAAGAEGEITFTISVPKTLTNKYSLADGNMEWVFDTEKMPAKPVPDDDEVDTGDHSNIVLYVVLAVLAGAGLFILWKKRRKEADEDDEI